jgi:hypothetical protein
MASGEWRMAGKLALFSILYSLFSILYSLFSILYSLFSILYSLFSILYSLFAIFAIPIPFSRCGCIRVVLSRTPRFVLPPNKKGGRAPKGATIHCPPRVCRPAPLWRGDASGAEARHTDGRRRPVVLSGALAFRRPAAAFLAARFLRGVSAQAALRATGRMRALPAPSMTLKRSTSRAGGFA